MHTPDHSTERERGSEPLHLSDLPAWPELLWLVLAALLALGLLYFGESLLDGASRAITASSLVRGVPPPRPG